MTFSIDFKFRVPPKFAGFPIAHLDAVQSKAAPILTLEGSLTFWVLTVNSFPDSMTTENYPLKHRHWSHGLKPGRLLKCNGTMSLLGPSFYPYFRDDLCTKTYAVKTTLHRLQQARPSDTRTSSHRSCCLSVRTNRMELVPGSAQMWMYQYEGHFSADTYWKLETNCFQSVTRFLNNDQHTYHYLQKPNAIESLRDELPS